MDSKELCKMVKDLSIELMNTGKGDGGIYHCYSDEEIIEEFGHLTKEEVIREVRSIEGLRAELMNEVLAASGEYDFPEDSQPVRKEF